MHQPYLARAGEAGIVTRLAAVWLLILTLSAFENE
jgi:hypothetical protein